MKSEKKILWNLFHPAIESSIGSKALLDEVISLENVMLVNHYEEYPDMKIYIQGEQSRLIDYDLIVFQFPLCWYSVPALMKKWMDEVLERGFAYPPKEGRALHGKSWLSVLTTAGPEWSYQSGSYNNFSISELLKPLQQTAYMCGMKWVKPFVVYNVLPKENISAIKDIELKNKALELRNFIENYNLKTSIKTLGPTISPYFLDVD